jgi:hypothetical protein
MWVRTSFSSHVRRWLAVALLFCLPVSLAAVVELKAPTIEAFDRYVRLTERRMATELPPAGQFLAIDQLPLPRREAALAELRRGLVFSFHPDTRDGGRSIKVPGGTINHWNGTIFIPGASVGQVASVLQDYDRHQEFFRERVVRSRTLSREGDAFVVALRFKLVKVWTAVLNTEHHVRYVRVSPTQLAADARTTRIAEVIDGETPREREHAVGRDNGYLWRVNSYWRVEEREGGSYLQCESIALGRDIPFLFRWIVEPILEGFSKDLLIYTLERTRDAVMRRTA